MAEPLAGETVSRSFQALDDQNTAIPPDTHGAAGPNHLMTVLNTEFRVQDKNGTSLGRMDIDTFWNVPNAFDPKVVYDPLSNRWVVVALAGGASVNSVTMVAVSRSNSPLPLPTYPGPGSPPSGGNWNIYYFAGDQGTSGASVWADYPGIGFNKKWIVITLNLFTITGNTFSGVDILVLDKADFYAGSATPDFDVFYEDETQALTLQPAATYDPLQENLYLVQDFAPHPSNPSLYFLRIDHIGGTAAAPTFNPADAFPSGPAWAFVSPENFAPQSGTSQKIMTNDARMQNCVFRNGDIWCTQTVFFPPVNPTRSSVQWWEMTPTGVVKQRGLIDDADGVAPHNFFAFPSIAVNADDAAVLGYSRFSAGQFASANYAFRSHLDPPNTFGADTVLKAGEGIYHKTSTGTRNRWGDYSATVVDPANGVYFWTVQEYAAAPVGTGNNSGRWGTWWGEIKPPPTIFISAPTITRAENAGPAPVTIRRLGDRVPAVSAQLSTTPGTALSTDFTDSDGVVTFASGDTEETRNVPIVNDALREPNEALALALSSPTGGAVLGPAGSLVILASDQKPDLEVKVSGASYYGLNRYYPTAQIRNTSAAQGQTRYFFVKLANKAASAGGARATIRLRATNAPAGSSIVYRNASGLAVLSSSLRTTTGIPITLNPGQIFTIRVDMRILSSASDGQLKSWLVTGSWVGDGTLIDRVGGGVKVL